MARFKEPPLDFVCPYKNRCPYLEERSADQVFREYQRANFRERHHQIIREDMRKELYQLELTIRQKDKEIDQLKAENKMLHQRQFKAQKKSARASSVGRKGREDPSGTEGKKRGAPKGHCAWTREGS